ncbi:MAG: hypothetical protein GXY85_00555 [Candidatus Brocadiaceae bacterium]|nr:hypothetical protein [Candidatus Brocadiaceae bacterium]
MTIPAAILLPALLAGLAVAVWAVWVEPRRFRTRRFRFDAAALGLPALKVLHLSDTHFHGRDEPILRFLEDLARREPYDLVVWTGDLIDRAGGVGSLARAVRVFQPRLGSFAVLAGHDYWRYGVSEAYMRLLPRWRRRKRSRANPAADVKQALAAGSVRVLEDESCVVRTEEGVGLAIVGLQDAFVEEPDHSAAWAGVPSGLPVVVLSHSPDVREETGRRGACLAFCGHTHGGQVRFPIVGALVTRSTLPGRLASGAFRSGPTTYVLGNGLGASPATPFRLLCPPEAVVVELTASGGAEALSPIREAGDV